MNRSSLSQVGHASSEAEKVSRRGLDSRVGGHLIGRWPGLYGSVNIGVPIVSNSLLFAVALHDKLSRGRVHPISLSVPILLIVETFGLIALVMPSAAWHRLAMWLAS